MSRYIVEQWPPVGPGMQTGKITPGVKVTDRISGKSCTCTSHRRQHRNREAAIFQLQMDDVDRQQGKEPTE